MDPHRLSLLIFCCILSAASPAFGQPQGWVTSNGVLHINDWPENATNQRSVDSLKVHAAVLPSIDTLSIGYGYRTTDARPFLTFALEWKPGSYAILDGERIKWDELPGDVEIEALRLSVDVVSKDEVVSSLDFVVDSLMLPPFPGLFSEEVTTLTWDTVFPDLPDSTAKQLFKKGFTLENPEITHISFAYYDEEGNLAQRNDPQIIPRRPSKRTVYGPNINIGVRIPVIIHRPRYSPPRDDGPRTVEPRGERIGRGDTTDDSRRTTSDDRRQTERRGSEPDEADNEGDGENILDATRKKKKKDDEEEDEDELLPAAIAGVAAVAIVAVAGGTVGYYGNTKNAPIGLTAGYVQPDGGVLLQVGVNSAVIERSTSETEHFMGKVTGFYDLFNSPIQPAIGMGVLASEDNGDFTYDFSASVGLVGNWGQMILLGGYDFLTGGAEIGLAVNLKAKN